MSSPKDRFASARAERTASSSSSGRSTRRIPVPPPPALAFTSSGNPTSAPAAARSVSGVTSASGSVGTPAARARSFAVCLTPMASMASGGGPTQVRPAAVTARANAAFSDRNP